MRGVLRIDKPAEPDVPEIYIPSYISISHSHYDNRPFVGLNARLVYSSISEGVNKFAPVNSSESYMSMGILTAKAASGKIEFYYLQHGTDSSEKVFPDDFELKMQFDGTFFNVVGILPLADNTYDLGSSGLRWRNIYVVNTYTGDVVFQNGWKITEYDENGKLMDGLRILDKNGEEIFKITEDGLYFKGKKIA